MPFALPTSPEFWKGSRRERNPPSAALFVDRGQHGAGIPRYVDDAHRIGRASGFRGSPYPVAVGARYFGKPEESEFGDDDQQIPLAYGSKWEGGRPVYQERVYKAAKQNPKAVGLTPNQVDKELKPRKVA